MIRRQSVLSILVSGGPLVAFLLAGCAIEGGASPYRRDTSGVYKRIEEYKAPDGGFVLGRAKKNRIQCPHCGVSNVLGRAECTACEKRLSLRRLMLPCDGCGGGGKTQEDASCPSCQGTGWVEARGDEESAPKAAEVKTPSTP